MRDTDRDWTRIADQDPYWGVLSAEDFRGTTLSPEMAARFFQTGKTFVDSLMHSIRTRVIPEFKPRRTLDFGCGVGRLTIPLASYSGEVVGLDIAPRMRELAVANAERFNATNVFIRPSDDTLSSAEGEFDLVNSHIVLQHIPPDRGMHILRNLVSKLRIGGVAALQITYAKVRAFLMHEAPAAAYYRRVGGMIVDILPHSRERPDGVVTMFDYDLNSVFALLSEFGGSPMLTTPSDEGGHLSLQVIFVRHK